MLIPHHIHYIYQYHKNMFRFLHTYVRYLLVRNSTSNNVVQFLLIKVPNNKYNTIEQNDLL